MSEPTTVDRVRSFVLNYASDGFKARGVAAADVPETFDLLAEEVIDSFGLLELIAEVERVFAVTLEFDDVDADRLTMIGPFSEFVASRLADGAPASAPAPTPVQNPGELRPRLTLPAAYEPSPVRRALGSAARAGHRGLVRARDKSFSLAVSGSFRRFGSRSVLQLPIRLAGTRAITIGSDAFIGLGSWLQVLGDQDREVLVIGDGASFAGFIVISAVESIRIGKDVSCARNVYIADHAHAYDSIDAAVLSQGLDDVGPIEIGDGAWLGENAVVLPGVRIGEGAVIGANSVVTSDVPPYALALGAPARVVRTFGTREA